MSLFSGLKSINVLKFTCFVFMANSPSDEFTTTVPPDALISISPADDISIFPGSIDNKPPLVCNR